MDSSDAHIAAFTVEYTLPATLKAGQMLFYNVSCVNGWVFDYVTGYNTSGRDVNPENVTCDLYVQGETRTLPYIVEFVCLREYFWFTV